MPFFNKERPRKRVLGERTARGRVQWNQTKLAAHCVCASFARELRCRVMQRRGNRRSLLLGSRPPPLQREDLHVSKNRSVSLVRTG